MEFLKKSIHMDQIGCEEQTQITLEDDVNIADAKPDVYQVVTQQGHVELEEVRASDGHVHVKGVLHFKVLYLADEETHHPACMDYSNRLVHGRAVSFLSDEVLEIALNF